MQLRKPLLSMQGSRRLLERLGHVGSSKSLTSGTFSLLSIFEGSKGSKDAGRKDAIRNLPKHFFPPPYFPRDFKVKFAEIHLVAAAGASCVRAAPNASIA